MDSKSSSGKLSKGELVIVSEDVEEGLCGGGLVAIKGKRGAGEALVGPADSPINFRATR